MPPLWKKIFLLRLTPDSVVVPLKLCRSKGCLQARTESQGHLPFIAEVPGTQGWKASEGEPKGSCWGSSPGPPGPQQTKSKVLGEVTSGLGVMQTRNGDPKILWTVPVVILNSFLYQAVQGGPDPL